MFKDCLVIIGVRGGGKSQVYPPWRPFFDPHPCRAFRNPPSPAGGSRAEGPESLNPCLPKFGENLAIIWPTPPFKLFHSPAFAPPAELKQASNMLGWEIPPPWRKTPRTPMAQTPIYLPKCHLSYLSLRIRRFMATKLKPKACI